MQLLGLFAHVAVDCDVECEYYSVFWVSSLVLDGDFLDNLLRDGADCGCAEWYWNSLNKSICVSQIAD